MMKQNRVAIITDADDPIKAEFIKGKDGKRLLFNSRDEAEEWLSESSKRGVDYRLYDGMD